MTRQPDFAKIIISYVPKKHIIETKSIKLYLWSFRDKAQFNERLVQQIAQDLHTQLKPKWIVVQGKFNPRGGIAVNASVRMPG